MSGKRAIQISMVKKNQQTEGPLLEPQMIDPEQINEMLKDQVQHIALTVGGLLLAKKAADTAAELLLIAGRKYI